MTGESSRDGGKGSELVRGGFRMGSRQLGHERRLSYGRELERGAEKSVSFRRQFFNRRVERTPMN